VFLYPRHQAYVQCYFKNFYYYFFLFSFYTRIHDLFRKSNPRYGGKITLSKTNVDAFTGIDAVHDSLKQCTSYYYNLIYFDMNFIAEGHAKTLFETIRRMLCPSVATTAYKWHA
jgi:hypothetical protein